MTTAGDDHPLMPGTPRTYWARLEDVQRAQQTVAASVDALLPVLAAALDPAGRLPQRFWRMAIGPFLWSLSSHVLDRAAQVPDTAAGLPEEPAPELVFFSCRDFILQLSAGGALKVWIDRCVDTRLALDAAPDYPEAWAQQQFTRAGPRKRTPQALASLPARLRRALLYWEGSAEVVHFAAPLSHGQALRMSLKSRGRIRRLACPEHAAQRQYRGDLRRALYERCVPGVSDRLAALSLLPLCALLPTAFVEQLDELVQWAQAQPVPKVLLSALGSERSPYYAALAARACAQGARAIGMQHGGCYGQTDPTWSEILENQISDHFCTWGYRQLPTQVPMPSLRLAQLRPGGSHAIRGRRVLWAYNASVNATTLLSAVPHFRQDEALNDYFIHSVRAARERLDFDIALRPYPRIGLDPMTEAWVRGVPGLVLEPGGKRSLLTHAAQHDLTVFSFPGATGFLEFLHADRPAILFSPSSLCPVREQAREVFQELIDAGLYATDEQAFASILETCLAQGQSWWNDPQRVRARQRFIAEFARHDPRGIDVWVRRLLDWADAPAA